MKPPAPPRPVFMAVFLCLLLLPALLLHAADPGWPADYTLRAGDELRVTVRDEPGLSGTWRIARDGAVTVPLAGPVAVAGRTAAGAATAIRAALADGYLRYPRVEAALASFRPVTVSGMVAKPGDYPYTPGMTAAQAVALAGGFEGQLDDTAAEITRHGAQGPVTRLMPVDGVELQPGDSLTITGRRRYRE